MSSFEFPCKPPVPLIADASVIINLNASSYAREIIGTLSGRLVISDNASLELSVGARFGHDDARQLEALIADDLIERVKLSPAALGLYESLIDGSLGETLDDGEAATIAVALEQQAVALLDERKARRVCRTKFPQLPVGSSAEMLLDAASLGHPIQAEAMVNALQNGRMRVPLEFVANVIGLIGPKLASSCPSLPRVARQAIA